ncbi:hypothetical protein [Leptolyngbya sp. GGD]|uniref:hypothetical protein n=1 Tax=Leptolyngbya sp. GGD TaxID=2997907 RepID=UPI00227BBD0E|nr:hypothetical protein [Leptolyngbya sp. GGD]MCY6494440.1 hypothetical protein [Leptolyngbya sp. GGD]
MSKQLASFKALMMGTAIATVSSIAVMPTGYAASVPETSASSRSAAPLGGVVTPFCPNNQPFPFPTDKCPTGINPFPDQQDLDELSKQMTDRIQMVRRSTEADKILVPFIQITF